MRHAGDVNRRPHANESQKPSEFLGSAFEVLLRAFGLMLDLL